MGLSLLAIAIRSAIEGAGDTKAILLAAGRGMEGEALGGMAIFGGKDADSGAAVRAVEEVESWRVFPAAVFASKPDHGVDCRWAEGH